MKTHENKIAVVTGAAGGIGQALCIGLAEQGANIVAIDLNLCDDIADAVKATGSQCLTIQCDVSDQDAVAAAAKQVLDHFGHADILINNAGIYPFASIEELTYDVWRKVFAVNLDSMFFMVKAFLPGMKGKGWGRIVNLTSNSISMAIPRIPHYMASKMGIIGFTRGLAADVAGYGITVNAIGPSLTPTPGTANQIEDQALLEAVISMQAIKRVATVKDYVGPALFLTSDASSFVTGQTYMIDGGLSRL